MKCRRRCCARVSTVCAGRPTAGARSPAAIAKSCTGSTRSLFPTELDAGHVYHLFPVRSSSRDDMQSHLRSAGIETLIHYPIPIPHQQALASERPAECPIAARVCNQVFSLPLYPALSEAAVDEVAAALASGPGLATRDKPATKAAPPPASNAGPRPR